MYIVRHLCSNWAMWKNQVLIYLVKEKEIEIWHMSSSDWLHKNFLPMIGWDSFLSFPQLLNRNLTHVKFWLVAQRFLAQDWLRQLSQLSSITEPLFQIFYMMIGSKEVEYGKKELYNVVQSCTEPKGTFLKARISTWRRTDRQTEDISTCWAASSQLKKVLLPYGPAK